MRWSFFVATLVFSSGAHADWPTLGVAIDRAREHALTMTDANGQVTVAQGAMEGARVPWLTNPYIEFQGWMPITTNPANPRNFQFNSFMFFPIEINGQRPARIDEADYLIKWKQQTREDARGRVTGETIAAYGAVLVAALRLVEFTKAEGDAKAEVAFYDARLGAADATLVEKSLADSELSRYSQLRAEAAIALLTSRSQLEILTALSIDANPAGSADAPVPHAPTADAFIKHVLEVSPLLRAYTNESKYWEAYASRVRRDANTPINFIVNFGRDDLGQFTVGGGLSWSLPVTQRAQGPSAQGEAARDRAESMRSASEQVLRQTAQSLWDQYALARTTLDSLTKDGIPAAERLVSYTQQGYKAGKVEYLHVLQARRDLAFAKARQLDLAGFAWQKYGHMAALSGDLP